MVQRLTSNQMDGMRVKRLCFKYDEKFHHGHIYKAKLLASVVANEEDDQSKEHGISKDIQIVVQ